jgi:hypothetical protein
VWIVDVVSKIGGDLDVLVVAVGPQPPVALEAVLLAQGYGIEVEDLAHVLLPLSSVPAEPRRRGNFRSTYAEHATLRITPSGWIRQVATNRHRVGVMTRDADRWMRPQGTYPPSASMLMSPAGYDS